MEKLKHTHTILTPGCAECKAIQDEWYGKLKDQGFEDAEDPETGRFEIGMEASNDPISGSRPLKKWSGSPIEIEDPDNPDKLISVLDQTGITQAPLEDMQTSWPEPIYSKEEALLNHSELDAICKTIFKHGNTAVTPEMMVSIWKDHCDGLTLRKIGKKYNIFYVSIFRAVKKLEELMSLMDFNPKSEDAIVVTRPYDEATDAAIVYSTWRNSLWYDRKRPEDQAEKFYRLATKEIKTMLAKSTTVVRIACLKDDTNQIAGYAVMSGQTIEFVYIKADYRSQGIARLLTKGFVDVKTPQTKIGQSIVKNHKLTVKENK